MFVIIIRLDTQNEVIMAPGVKESLKIPPKKHKILEYNLFICNRSKRRKLTRLMMRQQFFVVPSNKQVINKQRSLKPKTFVIST